MPFFDELPSSLSPFATARIYSSRQCSPESPDYDVVSAHYPAMLHVFTLRWIYYFATCHSHTTHSFEEVAASISLLQASNEAVESQQCVWNPVINPQLRKRGEVTRLSMLFLTTTALTIGLPRFSLHGEGSPAHPHAGKQSSCTLSVQSHTTSFRHSKPLQHVREKNDLCACMYARKTVTVLKIVNNECMSSSFS